jgi:hypothetical protein
MLMAVATALMLAVPILSSGAEFLLLTELQNIRLLTVADDKAVVQGRGGYTEQVVVGDSIGRERGKVVEIGGSYIIVETETLRIKLPLGVKFEP